MNIINKMELVIACSRILNTLHAIIKHMCTSYLEGQFRPHEDRDKSNHKQNHQPREEHSCDNGTHIYTLILIDWCT